jgi:hypothetical protein
MSSKWKSFGMPRIKSFALYNMIFIPVFVETGNAIKSISRTGCNYQMRRAKRNDMTPERAKKETLAIFKYLSIHSDPFLSARKNKMLAGGALGIRVGEYIFSCPFCELHDMECSKCQIYNCMDIGYGDYKNNPTKENAKAFYDKIKAILTNPE